MSPAPEPDNTIFVAAHWLARQLEPPQPILPTIKTKFGLTTPEACEVCRRAEQIRSRELPH